MKLSTHIKIVLAFGLSMTMTVDAAERSIKITGRKAATVTTSTVRLGDLAEISSSHPKDDEAVIGLQKIFMAQSPAPGEENTISAAQILERLSTEGVNIERIGYTFPRIISIKRASRKIEPDEILATLKAATQASGRDMSIRSLGNLPAVHVVPGAATLHINTFPTGKPNQLGFELIVTSEDGTRRSYKATAPIDEWQTIPVANRAIEKGRVVQPEDVMLARLNVAAIPGDAARVPREILGFATVREINFGEFFQRDRLAIPQVVAAGTKIKMRTRSSLIEATATGIAVDSGGLGQSIRVRNESSKKVIFGTVLEPGLVEVEQ